MNSDPDQDPDRDPKRDPNRDLDDAFNTHEGTGAAKSRGPRAAKKALLQHPPMVISPVIGWREWVTLPQLHVGHIKAKIDTGARSSSLHAFDVETFRRQGKPWVRFCIHPIQHNDEMIVNAEAAIHEFRTVRSSNGETSLRPTIITDVQWMNETWQIELTLANRDSMGFRMLLGREALRGRLLVDPAGSFLGGRSRRSKRGK